MFKPAAFIDMNNEQSKKEIKKIIPFKIISKRIKYLGINLIILLGFLCTVLCHLQTVKALLLLF